MFNVVVIMFTFFILLSQGLHLAEVGAWWDLSTYKWDGVKDQGDDGDQDVKMHLTKIFMAIFALAERLPTSAILLQCPEPRNENTCNLSFKAQKV